MINNYLSSIDGVSIFPILSFLIFFTSFCLVLLVTLTRRKELVDDAASIPLHDNIVDTHQPDSNEIR